MILLLASELDPRSAILLAAWAPHPPVLLTPADLSAPGWFVEPGHQDHWILVASGRRIPAPQVRGILNLLPYVLEQELYNVEKADRRYVATEMSAFLFFILATIPCPVLNRPTPYAFNGPGWCHEQWSQQCALLGIPVPPTLRSSAANLIPPPGAAALRSIQVLGNSLIQDAAQTPPPFHQQAIALARRAAVDYLKLNFTDEPNGPSFHSVELTPNLEDPATLHAVQAYFTQQEETP